MKEEGFNPFETTENKSSICECPMCASEGNEGYIYEGSRTYYCSNSTEGNGRKCRFILYKNNIEKLTKEEISAEQVNELCAEGSFEATCYKMKAQGTYTGVFSLKPMGRYVGLELSFKQ